ncbi:MAG: GPO family capsid scaffolding protein [Pseudodesulfovibrio sp.]|nr:GPO family capsid scaffolding protein [Pseudodesulfovibrio sp.]
MPNTFITGWKKIGQSGPTMDGRIIEATWLEEAAESYNPDTYTAVIWIDHFRFYGSQGKVVELKTEKDGEVVSLYARLQPNEHLLSWNKEKQKLFTSMELTPDFAKSGKCYLSGLGVTDMPASLGTHELHFNTRKQNPDNLILCGVELDALRDGDDVMNDQPPSWFTKAMNKILPKASNPETDEDTMTEQQFNALMGKFDEHDKRFTALEEKFVEQKPKETATEVQDDGKAPDVDKKDFTAELSEAMKPFNEKVDAFSTKLDDLTKRFEQAKTGTTAPENIQPATPGADYL